MIIIANSNPIHKWLESTCQKELGAHIINDKKALAIDEVTRLSPEFIFFPHWSFKIPAEIYERFECIVFHMTDLPYGRGGSPLQNLIIQGHTRTMISAIRVNNGIDTGDIYMKKELSLYGTAEEIFLRAGKIMFQMIGEILASRPQPKPQETGGETFKRRTPTESNIEQIDSLEKLFDFIRMLDADGYPHAYMENPHFRFEFTRASLKKDAIIADVRVIKK